MRRNAGILDLRKVFHGLNVGFVVTDIVVSFRQSLFDVLRNPFGLLCHFFPFIEQVCRELLILQALNPSLVLHLEPASSLLQLIRKQNLSKQISGFCQGFDALVTDDDREVMAEVSVVEAISRARIVRFQLRSRKGFF